MIVRLNDDNKAIEDYLLLPAAGMTGQYLLLSGARLHGGTRVETLMELTAILRKRFRKADNHRVASSAVRSRDG